VTIVDLHKLAYRRFPKQEVHDRLHEYAEHKFGVKSLRDCHAAALAEIARWVQSFPARAVSPQSASSKPRAVRPRGRMHREGVLRSASKKQWAFIVKLMKTLFADQADGGRLTHKEALSAALKFIRGVLGDDLAWPEDGPTEIQLDQLVKGILTSQQAGRVINSAMGELKRRHPACWRDMLWGNKTGRSA